MNSGMNFGWLSAWSRPSAYVMREIRVHDDDKVAGAKVQPVDIGRSASSARATEYVDAHSPQSQLPRSRLEHLKISSAFALISPLTTLSSP